MNGETKTDRPLEVVFPASGVCVLESHHSDDFRMGWTIHPWFKWIHVIAGSGRLCSRKGNYFIGPSMLCLVPPGFEHRIRDDAGSPLSLHVLCQRNEVMEGIAGLGGLPRTCLALRHPALGRQASGILKQMLFEQTARLPGWEALLVGLSLQLRGLMMRWKQEGSPQDDSALYPLESSQRVLACREEARRTFFQPWSLEQAATRAGLGVRRFSQLFRQLHGQSWVEFLRDLRIAHAREILRKTDRSIASVCFECGFEDLSNFYRAFVASEGISPQRWREKSRGA